MGRLDRAADDAQLFTGYVLCSPMVERLALGPWAFLGNQAVQRFGVAIAAAAATRARAVEAAAGHRDQGGHSCGGDQPSIPVMACASIHSRRHIATRDAAVSGRCFELPS